MHGRITMTIKTPSARIDIHAGMGVVFDDHERYTLDSDTGAILLIFEADTLTAHARGISIPQRIAGQTWPSDGLFTS